MKGLYLIKNGNADGAFELRPLPSLVPQSNEILIKVEAFGLNFADVMARKGLYPDCPPLPCVLGYEVVGHVEQIGEEVQDLAVGERVIALTRFGGYASHALTPAMAVAKVQEELPAGEALALVTQYCTAFYMAEELVKLRAGDRVLIHAAAGGVGTALAQIASYRKCEVFGTASPNKHDYLKSQGVHHPIDYRNKDFQEEISSILNGEKLDVIFDPIGGKNLKKGMELLGPLGKMVSFGASTFTSASHFFSKIKKFIDFGFYNPLGLMRNSQSLLTANLLRLGDNKPEYLQEILSSVVEWTEKGIFRPYAPKSFSFSQLAEAHAFLESRESLGKVAVYWDSEN